MKTAEIIILTALLAACASQPAKPKTAEKLRCEYESNRSIVGRFGSNILEAMELYRACLAAKKEGAQ